MSEPRIMVVEPAFDGTQGEGESAEFWARVDADPSCVVLVETCVPIDDDRHEIRTAIFSRYAFAMDHAKASGHSAIVMPKRIDEPSWGDVAVN